MSKPARTWLLFSLCLTVVVAAMVWISVITFNLQRHSIVEENVRLALWRMDSALAPIFVEESSRPHFTYSPFYSAERAYTRLYAPLQKGDVLVASPLLTQQSRHVRLHFQIDAEGRVTSPQVPEANMLDRAEAEFISAERLETMSQRLDQLRAVAPQRLLAEALAACRSVQDGRWTAMTALETHGTEDTERGSQTSPETSTQTGEGAQQMEQQWAEPTGQQSPIAEWLQERAQVRSAPAPQQIDGQLAKNTSEYAARSKSYQNVETQQLEALDNFACVATDSAGDLDVNVMLPAWIGESLFLVRRVRDADQELLQGCWLDWDVLQADLVATVADLFPEARLEPVRGNVRELQSRMLASLPVALVPGELPSSVAATGWPVRLALILAWTCVILAALAVGGLLLGTVLLSERRGAFVSAVTHELRTPLTTFRMYTEMLGAEMVPAEKRTRYLETLQGEADRLGHMVENVLSYARLEKGRAAARCETHAVASLVDKISGPLASHVERSGQRLEVSVDPGCAGTTVRADVSAVEQILLNLVDNACKHSGEGDDATVLLRVSCEGPAAALAVIDGGPGVPRNVRARLFKPFTKSAEEAANSAPGVGLGLALSRRLARAMGGDLRFEERERGASFVLTLPRG